MNSGENNTLKIRFRLPNGEEFEAEGPREFIEAQRNYFLALIGQGKAAAQALSQSAAFPISQPQTTPLNTPATTAPAQHTELYFWEKLLKEDGETLLLRHKAKLSPQETALILLAGARVLLKKPAYPALELARSLKACGVETGRLDRLLAGEVQAGRLVGEGSKRSRTYKLTAEGFARSFVLAEKLLKATTQTPF